MRRINTKHFPIRIESESIQFDKVVFHRNGNEELAHHTGYELWESEDVADRWFEYEDSKGEFHFCR